MARKRGRRVFWPFMIVVILFFFSVWQLFFPLHRWGEWVSTSSPCFGALPPHGLLAQKRGPLAPKSESRKFDKICCWKHLLQLPGPNLPTSLSNVKKIKMGGESGDSPPLPPRTISGRQIGGSCGGGGGGVMIGGAGRGNFLLGGWAAAARDEEDFIGGYGSGGVWAVK